MESRADREAKTRQFIQSLTPEQWKEMAEEMPEEYGEQQNQSSTPSTGKHWLDMAKFRPEEEVMLREASKRAQEKIRAYQEASKQK